MKLLFYPILIYIILTNILICNAQLGNVILLNGKIDEYDSGKPLGLKINFVASDGKKVIVNSNSIDGSYQAVLNADETYKVLIQDYMIIKGDKEITLPKVSEYTEKYQNFTCSKLAPGMVLSTYKMFKPNEDKLLASELQMLNEVKELLANNPRLILKIIVSTEDSWFGPKKIKVNDPKSKRKKPQTITISTEERMKELLEARVKNVQDYLINNGIKDKRIDIEKKLVYHQPAPIKKTKCKNIPQAQVVTVDNIIISVARLMNL